MAESEYTSVGLTELIEQVKQDLLSTTGKESADAPIFFIDSVELELKVATKQDAKGGIKIDVLPFIPVGAGANMEATASYENAHTIKVKLSPLYDKEKIIQWQHTRNPEQGMESLENTRVAFTKSPSNETKN